MNPGRLACFLSVLGLCALSGVAATESVENLLRQAQEAFVRGQRAEARKLVDQALAADPKNATAHFTRGRLLEEQREFAAAVTAYDQALKLAPGLIPAHQFRGGCHFRLGHIAESIADFDAFLKAVPAQEPHHWQRGISYYYAGRFADGKRQFEVHQTVNSSDVENAVWHFLCNARLNGLPQARKELIAISGDTRVPMKEVHALFAGQGTVEQVLAAAEAGSVPEAARRNQRFFAQLYLGLYFEAAGDAAKARSHIEKAAKDFSEDHYMGDVARVHLQLMNQAAKK